MINIKIWVAFYNICIMHYTLFMHYEYDYDYDNTLEVVKVKELSLS